MKYQEFKIRLKKEIMKEIKGVEVKILNITGNNGVIFPAVLIGKSGEDTCFSGNLNDYYETYQLGFPMEHILMNICMEYTGWIGIVGKIKEKDYTKIKKLLTCRLLSMERNQELLKNTPYIKWNEFAVVAYISLIQEKIEGMFSVPVTYENIKTWDIGEKALFKDTFENTSKILPACVEHMQDIIQHGLEQYPQNKEMKDVLEDYGETQMPVIVSITNKIGIYGAIAMLYPGLLRNLADMHGHSFYIMPSSVNEIILVSSECFLPGELRHWHREVARNIINTGNWLSDEIYMYDRELDEVTWVPEDSSFS